MFGCIDYEFQTLNVDIFGRLKMNEPAEFSLITHQIFGFLYSCQTLAAPSTTHSPPRALTLLSLRQQQRKVCLPLTRQLRVTPRTQCIRNALFLLECEETGRLTRVDRISLRVQLLLFCNTHLCNSIATTFNVAGIYVLLSKWN